MNTVHICGNIGAEPEFKLFQNGKRKVSFSVALNQFKKDGGQVDTIWVPCQAWDSVYDRLLKCKQKAHLSGRKINITGNFVQTKWVDQSTGRQHQKLMVKIHSFELLGLQHAERQARQEDAEVDPEAIFDGKPIYKKLPFHFKSNELRAAKEECPSKESESC